MSASSHWKEIAEGGVRDLHIHQAERDPLQVGLLITSILLSSALLVAVIGGSMWTAARIKQLEEKSEAQQYRWETQQQIDAAQDRRISEKEDRD